jgi:glutamate--cysteine ligase catalytic subunit
MEIKQWSEDQKSQVDKYLSLLTDRARGKIPSDARFIRDFVLNHPEYKQDSVVSPQINYDLMKMVDSLENQGPESATLRSQLIGAHDF